MTAVMRGGDNSAMTNASQHALQDLLDNNKRWAAETEAREPGFFSRPIRTVGAQRVRHNVVRVVQQYLEKAARAAGGRAA